MTTQTEYFFNDGYYRSLSIFYKTTVLNQINSPNFKLDITATEVNGSVGFGYVFYEDDELTQYIYETLTRPIVIGTNHFQVDEPTQYFVVGRLSLLPGSTIGISSFKINNIEQVQSGVMGLDIPPVFFTETKENNNYLKSLKLYQIFNPNFKIELQVQSMTGQVKFEFLKYTDETYTTQILNTNTMSVQLNYNEFKVDSINHSFILGRLNMPSGSNITISSFKINGVEQFKNGQITFTTTENNSGILQSTICFPAGTFVKTDQGQIEIQKLNSTMHTLQGKKIVAVTETYSMDKVLVYLEKDALRKNYPNQETIISKRHKIYYKGKMKTAQRFVGKHKGIYFIPYSGEKLYNVLLEEYGKMNIHGMICETLHPMNPIAKIFCDQ